MSTWGSGYESVSEAEQKAPDVAPVAVGLSIVSRVRTFRASGREAREQKSGDRGGIAGA